MIKVDEVVKAVEVLRVLEVVRVVRSDLPLESRCFGNFGCMHFQVSSNST